MPHLSPDVGQGRCWAGWPRGDTLSHQPSLDRCVGDSQPGRTAGTPHLGMVPGAQATSGSLWDGVGLGGLRCTQEQCWVGHAPLPCPHRVPVSPLAEPRRRQLPELGSAGSLGCRNPSPPGGSKGDRIAHKTARSPGAAGIAAGAGALAGLRRAIFSPRGHFPCK